MRFTAIFALPCFALVVWSRFVAGAEPPGALPIAAPPGFRVAVVASAPLVERPMFAALDSHGALYVLDSGGSNGNDRRENPSDLIRRLTDTNGDGVYDQSVVFADKIVFGSGLACYDGAVFVTSPPSLWRFDDTTGDGKADKRTELVTGFAFNQSCTDDLHGATAGPDGRIYFLPGRFHHKATDAAGRLIREGVGPWLMRCLPDGREAEIVSGAVGNPVEAAFLPNGDMFVQGTFWAKPSAKDGLRDALIHAVPGGEYSVRDRDYTDRIRTGDFLPALVPFTATAPGGLTAYQSDAWGVEYRQNLFTTHFNTGKLLRHRLSPKGGTYVGETEDFVTPVRDDVHLTDVLEDGDGSLLVVDTGGWYRACCPASGSSKPAVKGGVYRVSREGPVRDGDAYGRSLPWEKVDVVELTKRLDDPRFVVRDRAMSALTRRGEAAVAALSELSPSRDASPRRRQNAVWTLCRIELPSARAAVRKALDDPDPEVRRSAVHAAALHRDEPAFDRLVALLRDESPAVRRTAAHALGRIGRGAAVAPLLEAVAALSQQSPGEPDRFVEHALIDAIIRLADPEATRRGLAADGFAVRRAALLALDQMPLAKLRPEEVAPLLSSDDPALRQTAIAVLARHPDWTAPSIELVELSLNQPELDEHRIEMLAGLVRALRSDQAMTDLLDRRLADQDRLSTAARRALLTAMAGSEVRDVPPSWRRGLAIALRAPDASIRSAALHAVESLSVKELAEDVRRLAADDALDAPLRLAALRALTGLQQEFTDPEFEYLLSRASQDAPVQERLTALDVLAETRLDAGRLRKLLPSVRSASPVELPRLLTAFSRGGDEAVGRALVEALEESAASPAPEIVEPSLRPYGASVLKAARPLLQRLRQSAHDQVARLDELEVALQKSPGDAQRGRALFYGKAQCHLCHAVAQLGGKVGPDLSAIGDIRNRRGLLEAVAFPSASFARGFEPLVVELTDGRLLVGLAGRETQDELVLTVVQDNKPVERPLRRALIEQVQVGRVSTMPSGLDRQLQPQELSDLIAYLQQLRRPASAPPGR